MAHRFFAQRSNAQEYRVGETVTVQLSDEQLHHAARVVRLRRGEQIEVILKDGWESWSCSVESVDLSKLKVLVLKEQRQQALPVEVDLIWGIAKHDKNERIVRSCAEIGVSRFVPTVFSRSNVRINEKAAASKVLRLKSIADSAAAQAHLGKLAIVEDISSFANMIQSLSSYDACIVLWEEQSGRELSLTVDSAIAAGAQSLALIVGPEGGISHGEIEELRCAGAVVATMGKTILRVETACIVASGVCVDRIRATLNYA